MAKNDKTVKRGVYLYIDGKEIKNDINSIDLEVKRLQRDIKDMTRGSEEYNRTMQKIRNLKSIIREHRNEIKGITEETKKSTISVGKLVDGFNRFGGVIVAVIGFLTGVTLALRSFRDERNKLEESQAGLKALTGLDDDSIDWLTEQAKKLSTTMTKEGLRVRQSASEILDAYMLVGSAKPELLGDKEALAAVTEEAMRLQAAAKDIKLSEAVDALTLSLNQYGAAADQAGRFSNVLAAGSKEGAANIASQARTIRNAGVAAASANVSIEQTVGLIETLAEKGIKDEVAGTGLKKFFLVLQTGADETNPKIVGLNQALENLKEKSLSAGDIKDMFGEEGYNVASVILQDIDKVKQYTEAVTGTNIAYEQAAINSRTAAAALDQARNKMKLAAVELGEKLNPAFTVSTNLATNLLKTLPGLIDWFQKWGPVIVALLVPVAAYIAYLKLAVLYHTLLNAVVKQATVIQAAYRAATIALNYALAGDYKAITRLVLSMRSANVVTKLVTASTLLLRGAVEALTLRFGAASKAMTTSWAVMKMLPAGIIVAGIAAISAAIYMLAKNTSLAAQRQRELRDIHREAENSISGERTQIESLRSVLEDANQSYANRKAALDKLKEIVPDYHADLTKEGQLINNNTAALDGYIEKLLLTAKQQAANTKLQEALNDRSEWINENGSDAMKFKYLEWEIKAPENAGKSVEELAAMNGVSPTAYKAWQAEKKRLDENVAYYENMMADYTKQIVAINNKYAGAGAGGGVSATNETTGGGGSSDKDKFAAVEAAYYKRIAAIKKQYLNDDKMTQADYSRQMQEAELALLNDKLRVAGLEPKERQQIADQVLDTQIKMRDDLRKQEEKDAEEASKETSTRLQKQYQLAVESATMQHYQLGTSQEEFYQELRRLQDDYYKQMLEDTTVSEEQKNKIREQMRKRDLDDAKEKMEKETKERKKQYEEQQKLADTYVGIVSTASQELGEAFGDLLSAQDDAMKKLWKQLLLTAVEAIEQYIRLTYIKALADSIIGLNFVKALPALAKIAAIETAFAAVKGMISNFYTGGFTPSGDWDQPQGIVHSNEFVANRFAVANPHLRPIFDAIDVAQRSGNVGNLTADDVLAVSRSSRSASPVPASVGRGTSTTTTNDPALVAMLAECTKTLRRLTKRLDEPIHAYTTATGKMGVNEAQKLVEKMNNNISRSNK
ncbi:phage tail tape measure protein [uncultured Bacteroides sp.]|uniref:phage tail tape measure protein n=1 Tax=uncultured Bacteroides sp. TaxID=162156 RepID=UPI00261C4C14|nr:phage tail tape measure protein [uncultured Bacteroides sp.]